MLSDMTRVPTKEHFMSRLRAFERVACERVVEKNVPAFAKCFAAN